MWETDFPFGSGQRRSSDRPWRKTHTRIRFRHYIFTTVVLSKPGSLVCQSPGVLIVSILDTSPPPSPVANERTSAGRPTSSLETLSLPHHSDGTNYCCSLPAILKAPSHVCLPSYLLPICLFLAPFYPQGTAPESWTREKHPVRPPITPKGQANLKGHGCETTINSPTKRMVCLTRRLRWRFVSQ